MTAIAPSSAPTDVPKSGLSARLSVAWWYVGAVVVGSAFIVRSAVHQPFNQNELIQIAPYGSSSLHTITSATRQPPLDPLAGALIQHIFGVGQLQQRLIPMLAGIGTLILVAALLWRLRLGAAGAVAIWFLATAPLMVRYSAYTRPYATPLFLMMVFLYCAVRWLDDRKWGWLVPAGVAAVALPLTRVPEPCVFLATVAIGLAILARRKRLTWRAAGPVVAIAAGALLLVGLPEARSLKSKTSEVKLNGDSITHLRAEIGAFRRVVPGLLADWFPWWPITLVVVIAALAIASSRRRLLKAWQWWALILPPIAFMAAYHLTFRGQLLPYRSRFLYFFVAAFTLLIAALASVVFDRRATRGLRVGVGVLLAASFVSQLPATAGLLIGKVSPDFGVAAHRITADVPANAVVLYDNPTEAGLWRQAFWARPRYYHDPPAVVAVPRVGESPKAHVPDDAPIYLLLLDSRCGSAVCDYGKEQWHPEIAGWRLTRFDKFALYSPLQGQHGLDGALVAMTELSKALRPAIGFPETYAAANLLAVDGKLAEGKALVDAMFASVTSHEAKKINAYARKNHLRARLKESAASG